MKLTLDNLLNQLDSIPLSLEQFKTVSNINSFLSYEDLLKYNSFEDLFNKLGDKILLIIKSTPNFGHYATLFKYKNVAYFYDSYALTDKEIEKLFPYSFKLVNNSSPLEILRKNSQLKFDRNTYRHQEDDKLNDKRMTCGFHVGTRLRYNFTSNKEYDEFLKSTKMKPDDFVVLSNLNTALDIM